jgi:signal peptidase I
MSTDTAEEKVSIQLGMATTPEEPVLLPTPTAPKKQKQQKRTLRFGGLIKLLGKFALIAILSTGCYYGISHFLVQTVEIQGDSMVPTLQEKNHYLLNRWVFRNHEPRRGDIVVFRDPGDNGFSVKRVIALSGESVHIKEGKVYVNGNELRESYLLPKTFTFTYSQAREQFITCGKDQYFLLGDNRVRSIDSRSYGPVPRKNFLGLITVN